MWLTSHVAVAVVQAGGYSSDLTPSMGSSICCGCGLIRAKKKKKPLKTKTKQNKTKQNRETFLEKSLVGQLSRWSFLAVVNLKGRSRNNNKIKK